MTARFPLYQRNRGGHRPPLQLAHPWLLLFLVIAATTISSTGQTPANEWRQFRGNLALTGVAATAPPVVPKLLWTYETGDAIDSSAAIANGMVYVGVGNGDLIAV